MLSQAVNKIKIEVIKNLEHNSWDKFVEKSTNGTVFHQLKFLKYHPKDRFKFYNLLFFKKNKLIAVLPGSLDKGVFKSPVGASYGSFVTNDITLGEYEELIDSFLVFCKRRKIKEVYLTPPPTLYFSVPNDIESFLLSYKGFKVKYHLISNALNLTSLGKTKDILYSVQKRFRNDIKHSKKYKMKIEFNSDLKNFYPILLENKNKFNLKPVHNLEEMKKLSALFPKNIKLLMAYDKNGFPMGGIWLFLTNKTSALTFYIALNYKFKDQKVISRLLYETIRWLKKEGYFWFDLGVSMDTSSKNPMEPSRSLIFFKESIGSKGFLRTTYWKKI